MMQIRSKLRQPALYVAGLSVLFLLLVAACGGGNGDDESPAPVATAAPATQPPVETPTAPAESTPAISQQGEDSSGSEILCSSPPTKRGPSQLNGRSHAG